MCLVSNPSRAPSCWDIPRSTEAYSARLPREPRGLGSDGAGGGADEWEELKHPLVSLRVERQAGSHGWEPPRYGEMWSPENGPMVGALARFGKLRSLPHQGRKGSMGNRRETKSPVPFRAMGPAPGSQRGRTAVTQVV